PPLLGLLAPAPGREDGEVRRRAVGIDVGEAAEHAASLTAHLTQRLTRGGHDPLVEAREALPGDRRLERLAHHPERDEQVAHVWRTEERVAPGADRVPAAAAPGLGRAAVLGADLQGARELGVHGMVRGLE